MTQLHKRKFCSQVKTQSCWF